MSSTSLPITPSAFRTALPSLPLSQLYAKAAELRNSILHLQSSNLQLMPFAFPEDRNQTPDQDCVDAIIENEQVIKSMEERMAILKDEVERRGARWVDIGDEEADAKGNGEGEGMERMVNGEGELVNGVDGHGTEHQSHQQQRSSTQQGPSSQGGSGGRLSDEELRRQLMERLGHPDDEGDEAMHL